MGIRPQKSYRYLICTTGMLLVLLVCLVVWQKAEGRAQAGTTSLALRNEEAVSYLKQQGLYGSLSEAMTAARYSVQWSKNTPWKESKGAFYANNPAQQMTAFFTPRGIHLQAKTAHNKESWKVGLRLSAYGYGEELETVDAGEVKVEGNRAEIRRQNGLTEWFINQAEGIEHGFQIAAAPDGRKSAEPLRLRLELEGNLYAKQLADAHGIELQEERGECVLRYDNLHVFDANGKELTASLQAAGRQVWLEVAEHEAVYPLTIDPTFSQQQKLTAPDGAAEDLFGSSVAISGETIVVGAQFDDVEQTFTTPIDQGSAYVFVRTGAAWALQQKLTASDGTGLDQFGTSVAISGETIVVGAPGDDIGASQDQGSAYVFVRLGAVWTEQQKLTTSDGTEGDQYGSSVTISGETLVAGAPFDDVGANQDQGSAYVFVRAGTNWTQQQKLTASDGAFNDRFAISVAISGETLVVGTPFNDIGVNQEQGSAYVFVRTGTVWALQQQLTAPNNIPFDEFGYSVAISGETIVIGAPFGDTTANPQQGPAYVFVRTGVNWALQQQLTALDGKRFDEFGISVAISGETIVIGAHGQDVSANQNQGAAYIFVRAGTIWSQQQKLTASDSAVDDQFGRSVAISGETIVASTIFDTVGGNLHQGSAYVFACGGAQHWIEQATTTGSNNTIRDGFGHAVAISGETAVVGADGDDIGGNINQGSVYIFVRTGTNWSLQQKITASDAAAGDLFGDSVAISGETIAVGAQGDDSSRGSVYVFVRTGTNWNQQQKITASDGIAFDSFGSSIAISSETIAIGALADDIGMNENQGSAYIFVRSGTNWTQQQKLVASDGAPFDAFGFSVTISGETIVVGALADDIGMNESQGSAYVFVRSGTNWNQQQKLTAADGLAQENFGWSVSISGETIVVGAVNSTVGGNIAQGSAYVFIRTGTNWNQQQKLNASDGGASDFFGESVAISGETIVIGATGDNIGNNSDQGSAYVFVRTGASWNQMQKLTASNGQAGDQFGISIAINGVTILVGATNSQKGIIRNFAYMFFRDCIVINYDVCLQDDTSSGTVLQFNSTTGEYRFCCSGTTYTGTGIVNKRGSIITLQHNTSDRRLQASIDTSQNRGTASLQSPVGLTRCLITDRDTRNNTCSCQQ
jgi:uncharacterized RmlC-like cupin family protein